MKKALVLIIVAVAALGVAAGAFAESRILSVSGIVRITPAGSEQAAQAVAGQPLPDGTTVNTAENGRVAIEVSPGNIVRLRGDSKIVVGSPRGQVTRFKLIAGKIRGVFGRLTGGERFEVEFSSLSAVASVKGTTFDASDGSGGAGLQTYFGAIELIMNGSTQSIPQGCGMFTGTGGVLVIRIMTDGEIQQGLPGNDGGNRSDLRDFIQNSRDAAAAEQDIIVQIREDDFAVGRSLRDVHGNLARVDQRLIRPDPYTIQFVNLVKRDSYAYKGHYTYNGPTGARFDYLEGMIQFNMGLPDSVVDWPGFFTTNKDHVKAVYGLITMANGRPGDVTRDVFTRDTHFDADPPNQPNYFTFNGKNYEVDGSVKPPHADGSDLGSLWATSESVAYEVGHMGDPLHMITLRFEAYAINETGKILNLHDFTTDSLNDPFGLLKTIAVEGIISGVDFNGAQVFNRGNIDLIVIPDLVVAIAQKYGVSMASSISTSGN